VRDDFLWACLQTKKLQDRVDKCRKDVENTKDKYEEALAVLHKYNSTYVDDMTEVFSKTQDFEDKRLRFFKDILIGVHLCLDISRTSEWVFCFYPCNAMHAVARYLLSRSVCLPVCHDHLISSKRLNLLSKFFHQHNCPNILALETSRHYKIPMRSAGALNTDWATEIW